VSTGRLPWIKPSIAVFNVAPNSLRSGLFAGASPTLSHNFISVIAGGIGIEPGLSKLSRMPGMERNMARVAR
jgi:hypothetical protein